MTEKMTWFRNANSLFWGVVYVNLLLADGENVGTFWQVTDFHYDLNYSVSGNPQDMCHSVDKTGALYHLGTYGNYLCDSPWKLVKAAVEGMKNIQPNPDFILWTGDSIPHVNSSEYDLPKNLITIGNITDLLVSMFPNGTFFPVLGNHDPYPQDQMPFSSRVQSGGRSYYTSILEKSHWSAMLGKEEQKIFPTAGYYSSLYGTRLRLIGLNTNLYYLPNLLVKNVPDPGFQFAWLENQLAQARSKGEKVYLLAHIAPGAFELTEGKYFFYPKYNKHYLNIIRRYSDTILGQFYGHEHTDSFRVLFDNKVPVAQMFLSPAVTPWLKTNNPSVRLYKYDRENYQLLDVFQYFLNLTEANEKREANWRLEYQMTRDFQIPDVSPASLARLVTTFGDESSSSFQQYLVYNKVSSDMSPKCNLTCCRSQLCAIAELDLDDYHHCIGKVPVSPTTNKADTTATTTTTSAVPSSTTDSHHNGKRPIPRYMFYVIGALTGTVLLLFVVVAVLCFGRRNHMSPLRYSRLPSYTPPSPIN